MAGTTLTIEFSGGTGTPKQVIVEARDYCSDALIPGAYVRVTGPGYSRQGLADESGLFDCGVLQPGHYTLYVSATGYLASDEDLLANDGFVV